MGGSLRLLDVVDYPTYMVAMNALPPVPVAGRRRVGRRLATAGRGPRAVAAALARGAARLGVLAAGVGAPRLRPDRLPDVASWPAGPTATATTRSAWSNGCVRRVCRTGCCIGPWSHMSTATSLPGPHLDLVPVMARWWDRWLRGVDDGYDDEPALTWFAQRVDPAGTGPGARRGRVACGTVVAARRAPPCGRSRWAPRWWRTTCSPTSGTAAWNSCAGSLPWGQPTDQRYDDAASLTCRLAGRRAVAARAPAAAAAAVGPRSRSPRCRRSSATSSPTGPRPCSAEGSCSTSPTGRRPPSRRRCRWTSGSTSSSRWRRCR